MKHLGQLTLLDKDSEVTFDLKEEKWLNYLTTLSKFRIPRFNTLYLNNVPSDWEQVGAFMKDSVLIHKCFCFNYTKQVQIEGSKYIEALKSVAAKVTDYLYINNTDLTGQEFWDLVSAAKFCLYVHFNYDLIAFDEKWDFGKEMDGCRINHLYFDYSGFHRYSDWGHNLHRFENMVAAISRCSPLLNSLNTIYISNWDITKAKAQEILAKYSWSKIVIS